MSTRSERTGMYSGRREVELFKRITLYRAIAMQARGLRLGRVPRTALQVLREDYGLNYRTAAAALPAVARLVEEQRAIVAEHETPAS